jgi:dihydropteroate synthase
VINDVGGLTAGPDGALADDPIRREEMFRLVSNMRVPYIYMTSAATLREVLLDFAEKAQQLRDLGQKDIILDPGFGFGKTTDQDYALMGELEKLQVMQLPILVGISRKSMIWRRLGITPAEALNGTTALHAVALLKGANILRVHDVKEAVEAVKLIQTLNFEL